MAVPCKTEQAVTGGNHSAAQHPLFNFHTAVKGHFILMCWYDTAAFHGVRLMEKAHLPLRRAALSESDCCPCLKLERSHWRPVLGRGQFKGWICAIQFVMLPERLPAKSHAIIYRGNWCLLFYRSPKKRAVVPHGERAVWREGARQQEDVLFIKPLKNMLIRSLFAFAMVTFLIHPLHTKLHAAADLLTAWKMFLCIANSLRVVWKHIGN